MVRRVSVLTFYSENVLEFQTCKSPSADKLILKVWTMNKLEIDEFLGEFMASIRLHENAKRFVLYSTALVSYARKYNVRFQLRTKLQPVAVQS